MLDLISQFSLTQIITFFVLFALMIKGAQDLVSFFVGKYKEKFNKDYQKKAKEEELEKHFEACKEQHNETLNIYGMLENKLDNISESMDSLKQTVDRLTKSDMHDIKQFIVREYHYFVEQKKWIDDYSLDCILVRYQDYKAEGGNSYIETLVEEIKALPKHPPNENN